LRACLKPNDFEVETKAVASVPSPVMNLAEATNKFATVNALKDFLVKELAYMNTLELNTDDWDSINHLARAKFETYEWIYGRSPKATINKPGLEIQVEDGTITAITIDKLPATEVEMLRGLRYEFTEIKKALAPLANAQNILQLIF
ncbi:MAG TPA: hypothetical protein VG603_12040, partial [Chitinophagales bacterium]|nr:hypothetical protein [Chitinophagales bacterium]